MDYEENNGDLMSADDLEKEFDPDALDDLDLDLGDDLSGDELPEGFRFDDGEEEETY